MKRDKNKELIRSYQDGDGQALEDLIKLNEGLIYSIINRFSNYSKDDLFQVGVIGLIKAAKKFDFTYSTKFSTYAFPVILGEVKRYIRDDKPIHVSRYLKQLNGKIEQAREYLSLKYEREATINEISEHLEVSPETIIEALESQRGIISLDEPIQGKDGTNMSLYEYIEDYHTNDWFEKIVLQDEINKLREMDKLIIHMRYRLDLNQTVVAKRLGISQVQVSRLERKILNTLKTRLSKV